MSSVNVHILSPNFQLHLGGYLSPLVGVPPPPIAGLLCLLEHHMLVLLESTKSHTNKLEFDYIMGMSVYAWI